MNGTIDEGNDATPILFIIGYFRNDRLLIDKVTIP